MDKVILRLHCDEPRGQMSDEVKFFFYYNTEKYWWKQFSAIRLKLSISPIIGEWNAFLYLEHFVVAQGYGIKLAVICEKNNISHKKETTYFTVKPSLNIDSGFWNSTELKLNELAHLGLTKSCLSQQKHVDINAKRRGA